MATFGDFGGGGLPPKTGGGDTGGNFFEQGLDTYDGMSKVVASDPRVQAWETADFVNNSFLVRFQNWVTQPQAEATLASESPGASILEWNDDLRSAWVSLPENATRQDVLDVSHHFLDLSNTLYAEPNFKRELRRTPNDPVYPIQWNMNNTGQTIPDSSFPTLNLYAGFADADVDAPEAWDITTGSPNQVVAILDSGYNRFEADMQANYWVNPRETYNGKDDDGNGVIDDYNGYDAAMRDGDPQDDAVSEHGMEVASIVAAPGNDGVGMTGISWSSKLMFVKIEDDTGSITTGGVIGGIQYVTKMKQSFGINIVAANMSFGGPTYSFSEADALRVLGTKDVLIVAAAANQGYNHDILFDAPTGYNVDQIIAVTASNAYDEMNTLPYIPGGQPDFGYGAVNVDIAAPGIDVFLTTFRYAVSPTQFTNLTVNTGTSFAAPLVAGTAALMESLAPYLTAVEIKQMIIASADPIPYMTNLNVADGRLNVFKSLNAIPKSTISGTVFQDSNGDKVQGIGENGLGGWTVYLDLDNDGVFDPGEPSTVTVTNTSTTTPPTGPLTGTYTFDAWLNTGTYSVRQVVQAPFTQTTPTTNGGANRITVSTRGQDFTGVNFGNRMAPGTIRGMKFLDSNGNGTREANEPGLPGIMFFVDMNNNGRINVGEPAAVTGADGSFTIPNVQPGTYPVREILAGGYVPTLPATTNTQTGLPDPVLSVTVTSNTSTTPPLLFGNQAARDYGDLPEAIPGNADAYNTTIAQGGPSHGILPGFMLGTRQDFEANGIPSIGANGDDASPTGALSDEDGLISISLVQGQPGVINFRVTNGTYSSGFVQAWIDFDGDGSFAQAGDQILKNYKPTNGSNFANFPLPATATPGITYARLRYSHKSNLGPDGPAQDGEVEDYQFTIFSNAPIARPDRFPEQLFPPPNDPAYPNDPLIKQESTNNPLDVLRNDPLPVSGTLKILPGSFPASVDGNVLTLDTSGPRDVIRFTPRGGANPFTGVYSFSYIVYDPATYDPNGANPDPTKLSAPATVQVLVTAKDPRPVDNTYTMVGNVPLNLAPQPLPMDVTENDVFTPTAPVTVASFTQPVYPVGVVVTGPTVTRSPTDPDVLEINPPAGFVGTVQFNYTVTDSDPSTVDASATVTVQVTDYPSPPAGAIDPQYLAALSLRIVDARMIPMGAPGFHVDQGELFFVEVYTQDLRPSPPGTDADRGVEAAYFDLLYDTDRVSVNLTDQVNLHDPPGDLEPNLVFGPQYDFDFNGVANSPEGVLGEVGAAHDSFSSGRVPVGLGQKLLVRMGFNADTAGTIQFVIDPAEDPQGRSDILLAPAINSPDPVPAPDNLVFLVPGPTLTINGTVVGPEFVNLTNPWDVNADKTINAFDAVIIINQLNQYGARSLESQNLAAAAGEIPGYYVDTNNDGVITAFDVIPIINWLNAHPIPPSGGEFVGSEEESAGEFIPAVGSEGSEQPSTSSALSSPLIASSSSQGNNPQPIEQRRSAVVATSTSSSEDELLRLAAIDQLMAANVQNLTTSAARMGAAPSNWLGQGGLAATTLRRQMSLRSR